MGKIMSLYKIRVSFTSLFVVLGLLTFIGFTPSFKSFADTAPLSDRAKGLDANGNGLVDRDEARGPLDANFDEMDCDKNGGLDGAEIPAFFQGTGCPKKEETVAKKPTFPPLSDRAKGLDANGNGLVDRDEARGPLDANFDEMDCDKNGGLDGAEIPAFFQGTGCPKKEETVAKKKNAAKPAKDSKARKKKSRGGRPPQTVKLEEVIFTRTNETFKVVGRVMALQNGPLAARVRGAIEQINVNVGDRVKKGDVLVKLAQSSLQAGRKRIAAQVSRYDTMLKNSERELARMKKLSKSAAYSRARFEDQEGLVAERKAQYLEFRAALEQSLIEIQNTRIRAPFDAVVLEKHVEKGGYVNVGARVLTLSNDKALEVEADIPSFQVFSMKKDTTARIISDLGKVYSAKVRAIIPNENVRTRTRPVRLSVDFGSDAAKYADNQSVTVELPMTTGNELLLVNKDAVLKRANGNIVFVVKGDNATMKSVRLGRGIGNKFHVLKGLKAGDLVVVRGNERLGAGGRIKVAK